MKKILGVTLGILTAVGGFVDIGDLVANSATGARFGMTLVWPVLLGLVGIMVFADMSARVASISGLAVFDLIRERLGPRAGLANLIASTFVNFLTLIAEIAGIALALELASSINYLLWLPLAGVLVWIVIWRMKFSNLETMFGLMGLALVVVAVALWRLHPNWGGLGHDATHVHVPAGEGLSSYLYYAVALFASAMTPYEVFFFSSGAVEEHWSPSTMGEERANVFIGFPLGALLSLSIMATTATIYQPLKVQVDDLSQVVGPVALSMGKIGLIIAIVGIFACTFGAALETGMSSGYAVAQFFGWPWGKMRAPKEAARFHVVVLFTIVLAVIIGISSLDPIKITEYSLIFSAAALPLTYLPILLVANDGEYMGDKVNGRVRNFLGLVVLALVLVAAAASIPLMILTKGGG